MTTTRDTWNTDLPVCPYCGHETRNLWEINFGPGAEGDTTLTCGECEKEFLASRFCDITYTTYITESL
jgi:hypothetical protein